MNIVKTGMLLAFMTALFMGVGALIGGTGGMFIAFLIACGMNLFSYWRSDKMVLRMHRAVEVDETNAAEYYGIVKGLVERANMPMPKVYVIENDQPNAFATGRNPENSAVAATTGLLNRLTQEEVAGVMAHELAHIQNRDTLTMTITATFAGAISMLANFAFFFGGNRNNPLGFVGVIIAAIAAPFAASIVQMAISRTREYSADRLGAQICGHPLWLASALAKIAGLAKKIDNDDAERNPATAHMFIINPLHTKKSDGLFSTHPATQNRINALQAMEDEWYGQDNAGSAPIEEASKSEPWGSSASVDKQTAQPKSKPAKPQGTPEKPTQKTVRKSRKIQTGRTGRWGRNAGKSNFVAAEVAQDRDTAPTNGDKSTKPAKDPSDTKGPWG